MPLPPSFLDELRTRLPLSEVLAKRITLTRAGREFKACCPFHNEKTPSFYVNDSKGFFHCFGCGAHGDIIGFVMRHDRLSFPEAIEHLAQQAGMEVPSLSREEVEQAKQQKTLHQLCEAACAWYEQQLHSSRGKAALEYLYSRGLNNEAMARFRLGYAPGDGAALLAHLKSQGFEAEQAIEVGLARRSDDGRVYSFFRDRVMFPVTDRRGRVVAFGGRIMSGDGPKYINSPDHPLFHKGKLLYSLARAREAAPRGAPVIVVEGYMDVIALIEAGFPAAVAPLGTALTEDQIEELWKLGTAGGDPILCFDGDSAGQRAAARAVERVLPLLGPNRTVRIAFLPQGQDPDDLLKATGPKAMQDVLSASIPLIDMLWRLETEGRKLDAPEARAGVRSALLERVGRITDQAVQTYYKTEIQQRLNSAFGWGRVAGPLRDLPARGGFARPVLQDPVQLRQRLMMLGILNQPRLFDTMGERLITLDLRGALDSLWQAVVTTLETSPGLDPEGLRSHLCEQGFSDQLDQLLNEKVTVINRWARPGAADYEVERGLEGIIAAQRLTAMQAELRAAEKGLAEKMDEAGLARLAALRKEYQEAAAAVLSGEDEL